MSEDARRIMANLDAIEAMKRQRSKLQQLLQRLFDDGLIADSKRNRFLVQLAIYCIEAIVKLADRGR